MNNMNKKTNILLLALLCLNLGFSSNSSCIITPDSSTWHCSNNSPGVAITPGETGNLTFYCCYTSSGLTGNEEYSLNIVKKDSFTQSVQLSNGSWNIETINYTGTKFITNIFYNKTINPNVDIPITVTFSLPEDDEAYENQVIHARTDVMLNTGGSFILNNIVDIRIVIPSSSLNLSTNGLIDLILNPLFDGALLLALVLIIYYFYRKKK